MIRHSSADQSGFTLIELSIVLVIIGLIAGGILVGQDMIRAAEIRSTVKQIESYNSATNTFRDKYRFIPGDLSGNAAVASPTNYALNFGFVQRAGTVGHGDGNGLLEGGASAATAFLGEPELYWRDLNQAGMIGDPLTAATDSAPPVLNASTLQNYMPLAKLGRGNVITVFASTGYNFYQLGGVSAISVAGVPTNFPAMTPQEAFNLDNKMDDGLPTSGNTLARDSTAATGAFNAAVTPSGTGPCADGSTPANYYTSTSAVANTPACAIRVRFN